MKGCYILLTHLDNGAAIDIGRLGTLRFERGYYAYVGSAMNGLEQRISRHLRTEKRMWWHIDYLLQRTRITGVYTKESEDREECLISERLSRKYEAIAHFGSSDCRCKGHLFRIREADELIAELKMCGFEKYG
ncbi:MAG TPA: GIY-YIG nuclease family protein [Candidatus Methanofastidiosa archaeon]|nr:GIY-YIG nuclease family protein [Candidatus Methanofastidiosa archaeon]HPR41929.1 GIY-YIG nuclease family protein [Candidatus Methanofastidiosa archaeon]